MENAALLSCRVAEAEVSFTRLPEKAEVVTDSGRECSAHHVTVIVNVVRCRRAAPRRNTQTLHYAVLPYEGTKSFSGIGVADNLAAIVDGHYWADMAARCSEAYNADGPQGVRNMLDQARKNLLNGNSWWKPTGQPFNHPWP